MKWLCSHCQMNVKHGCHMTQTGWLRKWSLDWDGILHPIHQGGMLTKFPWKLSTPKLNFFLLLLTMSSEVKTLSNKRIYSASFKAADIFKMDNLTSPLQKKTFSLSLFLPLSLFNYVSFSFTYSCTLNSKKL